MQLDLDEVSRAFGRPVSSYDVQAVDPELRIHSVTGGVWRVVAAGRSLVVKVVRRSTGSTGDGLWGGDEDVAGRNYWKREWLAFDSGLLDNLPGRLGAPRTLLTTEPSDDECWIWMADVHGRTGPAIAGDDFDAIAYALGTTQGSYAADPATLPADEWLSRDWLRGWVGACTRMAAALADDTRWADPVLAPMEPLRQRAAALWDARDDLLALAMSAPPTIVHWDLWPANLFVVGDESPEVVAIDWSQVGISGVTHDLDQVTLDTVWMHQQPDASLEELDRRVLPAYLRGLCTAGLDVDEAELRRWYAASAAARYAFLLGGQPDIAADPQLRAAQERRFGRDLAAVTVTKARVVARAVELGEWALST